MNSILKMLGWLLFGIVNTIVWIVHILIGWGVIGWIIMGVVVIFGIIPVIGVIGFVVKNLVMFWLHLLGNAITFIISTGIVIIIFLYIIVILNAWIGGTL